MHRPLRALSWPFGKLPHGIKLLVVRYFNADLASTEGTARDLEIAVTLAEAVLEDMLRKNIPHQKVWAWDGRIWSMVRLWWEMLSCMDYILETDHSIFRNISDQ